MKIKIKEDDKDSSYRGNSQRGQVTKRKYRIRKMPKKLGGINPWFLQLGFNGTEQDDDETDFKEEEEEEAFEETEEETFEETEQEAFDENEEEVEIFDCCNISMINGEEEDQ